MKKHIASFLIVACLGTFSWAQGTKAELFDVKKSQEELEIMKGILSTTLSFVAQSLQKPQASTSRSVSTPFGGGVAGGGFGWRFTNLNAFYLYGQGAVFVIPTSNLRAFAYEGASVAYYSELDRQMQSAGREIDRMSREMALQAAETAKAAAAGAGAAPPPQAAQVPKPPAPPPPPPAPQVNKEELRKKVFELQEKAKKNREEAEANRAKFMASLSEVKGYLIEALANYGDSLTVVKPNEYISLVILTDDFGGEALFDGSGPRKRQEVISVQKSWITDYKAGRITLEAFKQKAMQYGA